MIEQLGLQEAADNNRLLTSMLPSPFRYRDQALLVIPRDFPSVKGSVGMHTLSTCLYDLWPKRLLRQGAA